MNRIFKYNRLFSVDFMHAYYRSLLSHDLTAKPTETTQQILLNYGLLFKPSEYGFSVFAQVKDDGTLKKEIPGPLKFTFLISCINPGFNNFTSLPLEQDPGERFYFSNSVVNSVNVFGLGTTELLLNEGGNVSEADLVTISGSSYSYIHTAAGSSKTFHLYFEDTGSEVISKVIVSDEGRFAFRQLLDGFPEGSYRLEVGSSVQDRFFFCPDKALAHAFGILEVFTDVPSGNKFVTGKKVISEKNYKIAFLNRSTFWRYKITNKSGVTLTNPAIAVGNDISLFKKDTALNFTSKNPRELKEEPETGIRFLKDAAVLSSEILNDMPNPGVEQIVPVREMSDTTIFSDIFIYL